MGIIYDGSGWRTSLFCGSWQESGGCVTGWIEACHRPDKAKPSLAFELSRW